MPRSSILNKGPVLKKVKQVVSELKTETPSILDLGIGHGTFGMLIRKIVAPKSVITGVEIWDKYRNWRWKYYDSIVCEDILSYVKKENLSFDIVLFIDVLEHFSKEDGEYLIERLKKLSKYLLIISTPITKISQGAKDGNLHERHLYIWSAHELIQKGFKEILHIYSPIVHKWPPFYKLGVFAYQKKD